MSMACFTSTALREAGNLVAKPSIKRRNVSLRAADMSASHFGTKALEEFEKSELGQLNMDELTALSEQVKQRVATLKNLELPAALKLPGLELPSELKLPNFSGVGDAVRKFGEGIDTPAELNAAFEALKSSSAAALADAVPQNGGDFAPHWGSQAISGVINSSTDNIHGSIHGLLHQIVVQVTDNVSSIGAL
ncbi:hypothetical protein Ndes2526B_g06460 [Nannochloris sp. 'desiccata']